MLAYGKLSKQQMAHESGGDNIGFEFSGTVVTPFSLAQFLCIVDISKLLTFPASAYYEASVLKLANNYKFSLNYLLESSLLCRREK